MRITPKKSVIASDDTLLITGVVDSKFLEGIAELNRYGRSFFLNSKCPELKSYTDDHILAQWMYFE